TQVQQRRGRPDLRKHRETVEQMLIDDLVVGGDGRQVDLLVPLEELGGERQQGRRGHLDSQLLQAVLEGAFHAYDIPESRSKLGSGGDTRVGFPPPSKAPESGPEAPRSRLYPQLRGPIPPATG